MKVRINNKTSYSVNDKGQIKSTNPERTKRAKAMTDMFEMMQVLESISDVVENTEEPVEEVEDNATDSEVDVSGEV